jgi:hypothetical protein
MTDQTVLHIGENSPEHVAFKLMEIIAAAESKELRSVVAGPPKIDRTWLLDTYAECLRVTRGLRRLEK